MHMNTIGTRTVICRRAASECHWAGAVWKYHDCEFGLSGAGVHGCGDRRRPIARCGSFRESTQPQVISTNDGQEKNFWLETVAAPRIPAREFAAELPDVAVIGGGYTGLSAARTLAKGGALVAVLEA